MQKIMSDPLPLYDQLLDQSNDFSGTIEFSKLSSLVNNATSAPEKLEVIMALIFHHSIKDKSFINGKFPYNIKTINGSRGAFVKIHELPDQLRKIIWIYLNGHKMN